MSLHDRQSVRHGLGDEVYASADLATGTPKYREALQFFEKHPVQVPMDATEASGFHH